jgi:hypothetical protein
MDTCRVRRLTFSAHETFADMLVDSTKGTCDTDESGAVTGVS